MPVLTKPKTTLVALKKKTAAVHHRRRELVVKNRKLVQKVVAVRQFASAEREIIQVLVPFFKEQGQSMVSRLQKLEKKTDEATAFGIVSLIFNPSEWHDELINRLLPVLAKKMAEAGVAHLMTLGIDVRRKRGRKDTKATTASEWANENMGDWISLNEAFEASGVSIGIMTEIPEWMQKNIAERLAETFLQPYWDSISKTTMGDAERVLSKGLSEGWSIDKMSKQLREYYAEGGFRYARRRSETVARTASGHALNGARKDSVAQLQKELGEKVPIKQSWLSVLGNTTRAKHADLDGVLENERGLWILAGVEIPWPGHFNLPVEQRANCQCSLTIEFGMDEEVAQREIEEYWARVEEHEAKKE